MKRSERADKAQETLRIIEGGAYKTNASEVMLQEKIENSIHNTLLYREDDFDAVMNAVSEKINTLCYDTHIAVQNITVLEAATVSVLNDEKIGCLNFASAKNPGGGFLGGAQAQEESLALSSALYPTLMKHFEMYEYNRSRNTLLYSDQMIFSPDVAVFRDDAGNLLEAPYALSFITSPAVNIGAMKNNNRQDELALAEETMLQRMDKVLALFVYHDIKHLLLGAWGCGVFQNDANDVAKYFAFYLTNGGKYAKAFKSVSFAVLDRSKESKNIEAFERMLLTSGKIPS